MASSTSRPDGTHTSQFDEGGDQGFKFGVDLIHEHGVSPATDAQRELAGEFGDAFTAGKIGAELRRGDAKGFLVGGIATVSAGRWRRSRRVT